MGMRDYSTTSYYDCMNYNAINDKPSVNNSIKVTFPSGASAHSTYMCFYIKHAYQSQINKIILSLGQLSNASIKNILTKY